MGLRSTKRSKTAPSIMASLWVVIEKAYSIEARVTLKGLASKPQCALSLRQRQAIQALLRRPTVCPGVTFAAADTYGCGDDRIAPTRCAVIDGALGDRCSQRRVCRRPPAGAGSAHSVLVAASRLVSPAAPGGFRQSRTTLPAGIRPYDDANPAKWVGSGRVTLRHVSPMPGSRAGLLPPSPLRTARASFPACRSSLANAPCGTRWYHVQHVLW